MPKSSLISRSGLDPGLASSGNSGAALAGGAGGCGVRSAERVAPPDSGGGAGVQRVAPVSACAGGTGTSSLWARGLSAVSSLTEEPAGAGAAGAAGCAALTATDGAELPAGAAAATVDCADTGSDFQEPAVGSAEVVNSDKGVQSPQMPAAAAWSHRSRKHPPRAYSKLSLRTAGLRWQLRRPGACWRKRRRAQWWRWQPGCGLRDGNPEQTPASRPRCGAGHRPGRAPQREAGLRIWRWPVGWGRGPGGGNPPPVYGRLLEAPAEASAEAEVTFVSGMAVVAEVAGAEISGGSPPGEAGLPEAGGSLRTVLPVGGLAGGAAVQGEKSPGKTSPAEALTKGQALVDESLPLARRWRPAEVAHELGSTVCGWAELARDGPPWDGSDWLAKPPGRERAVALEERMPGEPLACGKLSSAGWSMTGMWRFGESPDGTGGRRVSCEGTAPIESAAVGADASPPSAGALQAAGVSAAGAERISGRGTGHREPVRTGPAPEKPKFPGLSEAPVISARVRSTSQALAPGSGCAVWPDTTAGWTAWS